MHGRSQWERDIVTQNFSLRVAYTHRETNAHTRFFTNLILIFTLSTLNIHFMCTFNAQFVPNNVSIESPLSPEHKLNLRIYVEIQKKIIHSHLLLFFMFIPFVQKVGGNNQLSWLSISG